MTDIVERLRAAAKIFSSPPPQIAGAITGTVTLGGVPLAQITTEAVDEIERLRKIEAAYNNIVQAEHDLMRVRSG